METDKWTDRDTYKGRHTERQRQTDVHTERAKLKDAVLSKNTKNV